MTAQEILKQVETLDTSEKEMFYGMVMEGYFKAMMNNRDFMEKSFHGMTSYLVAMKDMGMDVSTILSSMEEEVGLRKAAC